MQTAHHVFIVFNLMTLCSRIPSTVFSCSSLSCLKKKTEAPFLTPFNSQPYFSSCLCWHIFSRVLYTRGLFSHFVLSFSLLPSCISFLVTLSMTARHWMQKAWCPLWSSSSSTAPTPLRLCRAVLISQPSAHEAPQILVNDLLSFPPLSMVMDAAVVFVG